MCSAVPVSGHSSTLLLCAHLYDQLLYCSFPRIFSTYSQLNICIQPYSLQSHIPHIVNYGRVLGQDVGQWGRFPLSISQNACDSQNV